MVQGTYWSSQTLTSLASWRLQRVYHASKAKQRSSSLNIIFKQGLNELVRLLLLLLVVVVVAVQLHRYNNNNNNLTNSLSPCLKIIFILK
jgi:hypothetical protein